VPTSGATPALSVILATWDDFSSVRETVVRLARQTIVQRIELVLVCPSRAQLRLEERLVAGFAGITVVDGGPIETHGRANALGVRRASAEVVALAEDHCFPDPEWAAHLVRRHAESWAAVGPAVRNGNPDTWVSWADLFIGYGPWLEPVPAGEAPFLPGHNTSYKRRVLLGYGERLEAMLGAETLLHWDLRAHGERLFLEAGARVAHTNFSRWRSWLPVQFLSGRSFAGARRSGMSPRRRAVYVAGSPLIPLVRLVRLAGAARGTRLRLRFVGALPALAVGLALDALGQMTGYAFGAGESHRKLARYEFRRIDHITPRDRREVFGG
jgi:glycosyl transferase family 2